MTTEDFDLQAVPPIFWTFVDASEKEAKNLLRQYPELLTDKIDKQLGFIINDARANNQDKIAQTFEKKRILIKNFKQAKTKKQSSTESLTTFQADIHQAQTAEQQYLQNKDNDLQALNESISAWERILQHPDFVTIDEQLRLGILNDSAGTYLRRYWASGKLQDLDTALSCWQALLETLSPDSPDLPMLLNNLGGALSSRYGRTGEIKDLQAAIDAYEKAVYLTSEDSSELPNFFNNLAVALSNRYTYTGKFKDLQASIEFYEKAVHLMPENSAELTKILNNLGTALSNRYDRTGKFNDLQQAIELYEKTVSKMSEKSHELSGNLNNLGNGLRDRYIRTGEFKDLQAAIVAYEKAIDLIPENSPELTKILNNLGNGLRDRYAFSRKMGDLQQAIKIHEKAVSKTPTNSYELQRNLNNLGNTLRELYGHTREFKDLQAAVNAYEKAVHLTPDNSTELPRNLNNLGNGLRNRYARTGEIKDLQAAIAIFGKAAKRGLDVSVELGLMSAHNWMNWAFERNSWQEIEKAYDYAHQASEKLLRIQKRLEEKDAWLEERKAKESWLKETQGLAALAAYSFVKLNKFQEAVVALERGLARLFSQSLEHKRLSPLADFAEIQEAAQKTPLIYILTTEKGGLALMVQKDKITPIELPDLTATKLEEILEGLGDKWEGYLGAYFHSHENKESWQAWLESLEKTTHWLWKAVMSPIINALPKNAKVTLIPVGRLNLLTLHAAWTEDNTTPTDKLYALDCLTIRYAPNARALLEAQKLLEKVGSDKLLAIDEPLLSPPQPLPNSKYEVETVASTFENSRIFRHENATRTAILNALNNYNVFHFSCHGAANFDDPLKSCLVMANNERLTLKDFLECNLNGVRLATLSACETNISGMKLPDEVVNLSAGLMQAGVAGVCASLWSVSDLSTMMLMTYFYDLWRLKNCEPAEALRQAQIWMRDTSNDQKLADFKTLFGQKEYTKLAKEMNEWLDDRLSGRPSDFQHPYHWAAFGYVGV